MTTNSQGSGDLGAYQNHVAVHYSMRLFALDCASAGDDVMAGMFTRAAEGRMLQAKMELDRAASERHDKRGTPDGRPL